MDSVDILLMKLSSCETIVNEAKFIEVYEARKDAVPILSDGVKLRMKIYKKLKDESEIL